MSAQFDLYSIVSRSPDMVVDEVPHLKRRADSYANW